MYITYRNTEENLRALAAHQYRISPGMRRDRRIMIGVAAFIMLMVFLMIGQFTPVSLLVSLGLGVTSMAGMLYVHRSTYLRHMVAAHRERGRNTFFGRIQTLSLTDSGIVGISRTGKGRMEYERILGIYTTGDRAFIYLNPVTALMLSEAATVDGDYHAFLAELKRRWERAAA